MRSLLHGGSCLDRPRVQWLCHQEASPHLAFHSPRGTEPETQVCAGAEPKTLLQALQAAPERCVASDYNVPYQCYIPNPSPLHMKRPKLGRSKHQD